MFNENIKSFECKFEKICDSVVWTTDFVDEVVEVYDNSPDLTLKKLSQRSGWSVRKLLLKLIGKNKQKKKCVTYQYIQH